jgi:glycerol kinase
MHVEDVFPSDEEEDEGPVQTSRTGRRDSALEAIENGEEFFIGSIDQGTTSSRFLIFDANGQPVAGHQIEFENLYPHSG